MCRCPWWLRGGFGSSVAPRRRKVVASSCAAAGGRREGDWNLDGGEGPRWVSWGRMMRRNSGNETGLWTYLDAMVG